MVYDEINDHVIMSTGITYNCVGCSPLWLNDAWVLVVGDMTSWSQVGPSSSAPGPRDIASLVFDSQRQRSVLFGGWNGSTDLNDVWVLNLTAVCGNGTCEVGETCTSCPADCGVCPQCDAFPCGRGGTERFVCHNPPGTAPRGITICIGADAVSAHLSHADYCGPCR